MVVREGIVVFIVTCVTGGEHSSVDNVSAATETR